MITSNWAQQVRLNKTIENTNTNLFRERERRLDLLLDRLRVRDLERRFDLRDLERERRLDLDR